MHILVSIKQVPDATNVRINPETGTLIREGVPAIINPYDLHAVEMAIELKEKFGGKVTVISMGPPKASESLLECIEQGADRAILVSDRKFAAADTLATSYVLARTIEEILKEESIDMYLFGLQAIDGDTAQVGPGVAMRLNLPLISYAKKIEAFNPETKKAVIHRKTERGIEVLDTRLPVVLTCLKEIAEEKRSPLSNMIKAASYRPEMWSAFEPVAFDTAQIGLKGSPTVVGRAFTPSPKEPGDMVYVKEKGMTDSVGFAIDQIRKANVVDIFEFMPEPEGGTQ